MEKNRCQSCSLPLEQGFFGTNLDGSANEEYCKYCFEKGEFSEPNLTLPDMIARTIAKLVDDFEMSQEKAIEFSNSVIPNLKRWKN